KNEFGESYIGTLGVDFGVKMYKFPLLEEPNEIQLQLWDTAGQESFHSIVHAYYRGVDAAVFVYDITDMASFQQLRRWIQEFDAESGGAGDAGVTGVIIGTKKDLLDHRKVPTAEGMSLARDHG